MKRIFLALVAGLTLSGMNASAQDGSVITEDNQVGDWLVRCVTQGEAGRNCAMIARAVASVEQRDLAIIRIFSVPADQRQGEERFAAQLTVPTNVNVRAGIGIQVDTSTLETVDYEICTQRNCITTFAVTDDMVRSFSGGFAGALLLTDSQGGTQSATFSLDGFSRAIDLL